MRFDDRHHVGLVVGIELYDRRVWSKMAESMSNDLLSVEGPFEGKSDACEPILRALPDWFGIESAIVEYVEQIDTLPTFLAMIADRVVGFLTISQHNEYSAEIHVMAIHPNVHRQGIGRALVRHAERWVGSEGVEYLQVKTLGPSRHDEPFERTRAFYMAAGFRPLEEFKNLWDETNPCLIMVKKLSSEPGAL